MAFVRRNLIVMVINFSFSRIHNLAAAPATWDDDVDQTENSNPPSNLQSYLDKVKICNRGGAENVGDFIPFKIENHVAGYVHHGFADKLKDFDDVFIFPNKSEIALHSRLKTPEARTTAVGAVVKSLLEIITPEIQDESDYEQLYPVVSSFDSEAFFSIERAAVPYFGIKTYRVHLNGYVEYDGIKNLWIVKRSESKPTNPGMLEHLVSGELRGGLSCGAKLVEDCEEEAGIMNSMASQAISVGVVSYRDIEGYKCNRDILFCYDLKLCAEFVPQNQDEDGEVRSVSHVPAPLVANIIQRTEFFKPDSNLIIIDFLFRHGYEFSFAALLYVFY